MPTYHGALGGVCLNDGLRVLMECDEPLLDGVDVVIGSSGSLGALEKSGGHCVVGHLEVEDVLAGSDGLLELLALSHLTGIAVDEEALGAAELLDHGLGEEVEDGGQGDELAALHDGGQVLSSLGAGGDFLPEEVTRRKMSVAILGHDLVALSSLATTGSTKDPDNGEARGGQGTAVNRLKKKAEIE